MTTLLQYLEDKPLPCWVLLKNTNLKFTLGKGYQVIDFEEIEWAPFIEPLVSKIPHPVLKDTRDAKELASYRYSEEELKAESFHFDTLPSALLSEANDKDLFGESHTIFWIIPPDKEAVINLVCEKLEKEAHGRISADQLKNLWDNCIDRIFIRYEENSDIVEIALLMQDLQEELIERISALDKAPTEDAWEVLNEDEFWNEEEF
jgi:hypothetical protein